MEYVLNGVELSVLFFKYLFYVPVVFHLWCVFGEEGGGVVVETGEAGCGLFQKRHVA